jgi:hypothetical protein
VEYHVGELLLEEVFDRLVLCQVERDVVEAVDLGRGGVLEPDARDIAGPLALELLQQVRGDEPSITVSPA